MTAFATRAPDKTDTGGHVASNAIYPADFQSLEGSPPGVHAMTPTMDAYESDTEGTPLRRFQLSDEINAREAAFDYNQKYNKYEGLVPPGALGPLQGLIDDANLTYVEYGMGTLIFHIVRKNTRLDSAKEIWVSFTKARTPINFKITDERFRFMALARRPDLLVEPYVHRSGKSVLAITHPTRVVVHYQMTAIEEGQAIPLELEHPGLPSKHQGLNQKLLAKLESDMEALFDRVIEGLTT